MEIPELVPVDNYDARQARLESGLRWLLCKAYGGSVPLDYQEAFFSSGLSSVLASRLTSSELFWAAAGAIFPEVKGQTQQGHAPLIQLLTRRGIYVCDVNGTEINEELLRCTSPFHLMAHITLLEGLMTAYINSTLMPENVVPAVRKFAAFSASNELPSSAEDAALFWVNKACAAVCLRLRESDPSVCPETLTINDVRDLSDGRCLAAVVSFYCPQELPISAIELGDSLAIADSLHNLQLTYNFCRSHLGTGLLTLTVTDLFYGQETLRLNILSFLADLFRCFEVEKASCVRDTGQPFIFETNAAETRLQKSQVLMQPSPQPSQVVIPQISDPTKRSFLQSVSTKQLRPQSSTANGARRPLLPRRQSDVSSSSKHQPLTEAWVSDSIIPDPSGKATDIVNASAGGGLLSDSRIQSSDHEEVRSEPSELVFSKDVDRKRTVEPPSSLGPLQSCVVGVETSNTASHSSEPLLPAKLRPSKEKSNNHSKKCEYSERGGRKKHKALKSDDGACVRSETKRESSEDSSSSSTTPPDGYKSPFDSVENNGKETTCEDHDFACLASSIDPEFDSKQLSRNHPEGQSYVARGGRAALADDVLAEGLSVVGLERSLAYPGGIMSGSSNDGSDQELHKLRADSRDKECAGRNDGRRFFVSLGRDSLRQHGGPNGSLDKGIGFDKRRNAKTSFAQIKQQKEAEKISKGLHDVSSETEGIVVGRPKGVPLLARPRKNTAFNSLQNQTTWVQESAQRVSEKKATSSHNEDPAELLPSELIGLRLKLEENRRQIENRKKLAEKQWHRQRQQMGKEAFIQVIAKNKSSGDVSRDERSSSNAGSTESVSQIVPVISDVGNTETYILPESQDPDLTAIQTPVNGNPDRASNQSDCLENIKILAEVVDPNSSSPVAGKAFIDENIDSRQVVAEAVTRDGLHSSADTEVQLRYDNSLDRINSSLTELHGVIQRLSRQQDQINSMVRMEVSQNVGTASPLEEYQQSMHGAPTMGTDDMLVQQFPMAMESLLSGAGANPLPTGVHNFLYGEKQRHQSGPSASPYSISSYPAMGSPLPPRFHSAPSAPLSMSSYQQPYAGVPPVSVPAERMYLPVEPGHQFVALGGQFHSSPVMHPMVPGMYPMSAPTPFGHYPGSVLHQQYPHIQNLLTLVPRPEFPAGLPPHGMAFPEFLPQQSSFLSQALPPADPLSFLPSAAILGPRQDQEQMHSSSSPSEPPPSGRPFVSNHVAGFISGQAPEMNEASDARGTVENVQPLPSQGLGEAGQAGVPPQSGGFFVNLGDPSTPLRQKPTLKTKVRAKSKSGGDDSLSSESTSAASMSPTATELLPSPDSQATTAVISGDADLSGNAEATSPLVFVIRQSAENEDDWFEMERRRQRLCELQVKRQEEQELRREKLAREQDLKREEQRLKQESTDLKRAEEKARREAIYQTYLQKKREKEMCEESPSKPVPPVIRRQRNALQRAARPKSQPAITAEMAAAGGAKGMVGRGSHDSLMMEGIASKTPVSINSQSDEKMNSLRSEIPLAFGGLTHRRPATPDPNSQVVQTASDGSESSGSQVADNYTGPKLFVKPSQKSNRHIITNAIGHCCLAGSVNRDVKDKVLEEISKSDAKHFIILFRDAAMQYRGLYTYNPEQEEVLRIHGVGPKQLTDKVMEKFYKYNSGSKKFSEVTSTKHLSATIDAITVLSTVWQKARSVAPTKRPL